jgi:hypothetical protein
MAGSQRIHLYTLCWNDARLLPYFFRHYDDYVDQYFIYDNGSTDESLNILRDHGRVHCTHFDVKGDSFVEEEQRLSDSIWRQSIGVADWVFIIDIDEHIYHPDLLGYLRRCSAEGVTAIRGIGYEMVSDAFPTGPFPLTHLVTEGTRSAGHDKLCVFDPDLITHTGFGPGRHKATPQGTVVWPRRAETLLLHFKQLGVDYPIARSAELLPGLRSRDFEHGWGRQYQWSAVEIAQKWAQLRAIAGPVPGLGVLRDVELAEFHDDSVVRESGLFDSTWYLATYPDVRASGIDPLTHFCVHGWREGRNPSFYFDTEWYLKKHPAARQTGRNPLVHYLRFGEPADCSPSERFDTAWYRQQHEVPRESSPLRHYLERCRSGSVSPLPDFNVTDYCEAHLEVVAGGLDPYEHSCLPPQQPPAPPYPSFHEVALELGIDPAPDPQEADAPVDRESVMKALRLFVRAIPVDEEWYRTSYPDAAQAISEGAFVSASEHFTDFGYFEGRSPRPLEPGA